MSILSTSRSFFQGLRAYASSNNSNNNVDRTSIVAFSIFALALTLLPIVYGVYCWAKRKPKKEPPEAAKTVEPLSVRILKQPEANRKPVTVVTPKPEPRILDIENPKDFEEYKNNLITKVGLIISRDAGRFIPEQERNGAHEKFVGLFKTNYAFVLAYHKKYKQGPFPPSVELNEFIKRFSSHKPVDDSQ